MITLNKYSRLFSRGGGKFSRIELFPAFQGERIITDGKEYLLKSKHFEVKIFTNCFRFAKVFPLENNPLYRYKQIHFKAP